MPREMHAEADYMTLAGFIETNDLYMTATWTNRNPFMDRSNDMNHWRCVISRKGGSRMSFVFSMGSALKGEPKLDEVLDCLASDASGLENANDFADWCADNGFSDDSRSAERTYHAIERQTKALKRVLGSDAAYTDLLWHTERL